MAELNYTEKGNDKKVLFVMTISLTDKNTAPYLCWNKVGTQSAITVPDAFKDVRVSQIKPSNTYLVDKQKRRRTTRGEVGVSVNTQARTKVLFDYLLDHPLDEIADIAFIRREIKSLTEKAVAVARVCTDNTQLKWYGSAPFVHLCHAVTDVQRTRRRSSIASAS